MTLLWLLLTFLLVGIGVICLVFWLAFKKMATTPFTDEAEN